MTRKVKQRTRTEFSKVLVEEATKPIVTKRLNDSLQEFLQTIQKATGGSTGRSNEQNVQSPQLAVKVTPKTAQQLSDLRISLTDIAREHGTTLGEVIVSLQDQSEDKQPFISKRKEAIAFAWSWNIPEMKRSFYACIPEHEIVSEVVKLENAQFMLKVKKPAAS